MQIGPLARGECNNRDPVWFLHPPTLLSHSAGGGSRRWACWDGLGVWNGAGGIDGVQEGQRGESSP